MPIVNFIQSITEAELTFISKLNRGCSCEEHYLALKKVIFEQDCIGDSGQLWFPSEVFELGSNSLQDGHEREFVICTLLVIQNAWLGKHPYTDLSQKFNDHAWEYDLLPAEFREIIVDAYLAAEI